MLGFGFLPSMFDSMPCFAGGPQPLSWAIRMRVAVGAARGLCFLHDAKSQVIYRDFKASNILLDAVSVSYIGFIINKILKFFILDTYSFNY